jgi:hypothetical protein
MAWDREQAWNPIHDPPPPVALWTAVSDPWTRRWSVSALSPTGGRTICQPRECVIGERDEEAVALAAPSSSAHPPYVGRERWSRV